MGSATATLFFGYDGDVFDPWSLFDDEEIPDEFEWLETDHDVDEYLFQRYGPKLENPYDSYPNAEAEKKEYAAEHSIPLDLLDRYSSPWREHWQNLEMAWEKQHGDQVRKYHRDKHDAVWRIKDGADHDTHCCEDQPYMYVYSERIEADWGEAVEVDPAELSVTPEQIESVKALAQKLGFDTETEEPRWILVATRY